MHDFVSSLFLRQGPERQAITIVVSAPYEEEGAYWCTISAPGILERQVRIAGVDGTQARALAFKFIDLRVADLGAELVDDDDNHTVFDESYELP